MLNSKFSEYLVGNYGANFSCIRVKDECSIRWVIPTQNIQQTAVVDILTAIGVKCTMPAGKVGLPANLIAEVSVDGPLDRWVNWKLRQLKPTDSLSPEEIARWISVVDDIQHEYFNSWISPVKLG